MITAFSRAMRCLCRHAVSVRPSVTFMYFVKTIKTYPQTFHRRVATPFDYFHTKPYGNTPTETP